MNELIQLPRSSLWNLAECDRDYAKAPKMPKSLDVILDIGAHVGIFALWALGEFLGSKVICYEPHPEVVDLCRRNLEGLNAEVHECAVVGESDEKRYVGQDNLVALYPGKRTLLGSSLYHLGWQKEEPIARVKWMPAKKLPRAQGVKADIEGAEIPLLRDYQYGKDVQVLMIEVHCLSDFSQLTEIALGWGLEMTRYNPGRNGCSTSVWVRAA